jgi:hypothetical protein
MRSWPRAPGSASSNIGTERGGALAEELERQGADIDSAELLAWYG